MLEEAMCRNQGYVLLSNSRQTSKLWLNTCHT